MFCPLLGTVILTIRSLYALSRLEIHTYRGGTCH